MHAHRDSGCGSSETTPTSRGETPSSGQEKSGCSETEVVSRLPQPTRKKILKLKTKVVPANSISSLSPTLSPTSSPSLHSPPLLSPLILKKCKNVKVSLTKCDVERTSSGEDTTTISTADREAEISVGIEEDTALKSSQFYSVSRGSSEIKKKKAEGGRDSSCDVRGIRDRVPAIRRDSRSRSERTSHEVPENTDILVTCVTTKPPSTAQRERTSSQTGPNDMETLKSTLFGDSDSDSDCIMLPSPCSSGEEEIINISFEDALRGVESSRGKGGGRRPVGVVSDRKMKGREGGRKGKERVREKTAGGLRGLGEGSGEVVSGGSSLKKVVSKKGEGRRMSRDASDTASKAGQRKSSVDQQRPTRRASGSEQRKDGSSQLPRPSNSKAKSVRTLSTDDGCSGLPGNNPDDLAFIPDSRSLVNLSAVAKSNQLTSTSVKRQRSHQAPPPFSQPPIAKPTYTIFKKKEVNVTGTHIPLSHMIVTCS